MEIFRWNQTDYRKAYGVLCSPVYDSHDRESFYPTFCKIPAGDETSPHSHFETEMFFIIEGEGKITIDRENADVRGGDLIKIPPFSRHQLENTGDHELVFLSVYGEDFTIPGWREETIITAAPPTPNGPLHLGHISGPYLASDILRRYLNLRGLEVRSRSGTDDHQNYVSERARSLEKNPHDFRREMRRRIQEGLKTMNIEYDEFVEPHCDGAYQQRIHQFANRVMAAKIIELRQTELPFCPCCDHFLVDALAGGICPSCEESSRGGCESCGLVVLPTELKNTHCGRCQTPAEKKSAEIFVFPLHKYLHLIQEDLVKLPLPSRLRNLIEHVCQQNEVNVLVAYPTPSSGEYLPMPGHDQAMHVWFEMAAHYEQFALSEKKWLHCFGFDNGFYYLLFIPALLRALDPRAKLPEAVVTNEFLLLEGEKFSTSRGHALWADEFTGSPDHLRLFLCLNRPVGGGADFSLTDFEDFSRQLNARLQKLKKPLEESRRSPTSHHAALVECNRFTREMELFYSPPNFDPRRAARRLLEFIDHTLQTEDGGDKLRRFALSTVMAPILPQESAQLQKVLGVSRLRWIEDWAGTL